MNDQSEQTFRLDDKRLMNLALLLILLLSIFSLLSLYSSKESRYATGAKEETVYLPDPFENIVISAKAAIVYDIRGQKNLYSLNADTPLPLASLAKIMTAVTALELLPDDTAISINKAFLAEEGDVGLYKDERWTLKDLIDFSLVASSNDAAAAIAATAGKAILKDPDLNLERAEFVNQMNLKARDIGMDSAWFKNETGLDIASTTTGAFSSANDYVKLLKYALEQHPRILEATSMESVPLTSLNNINHSAKNTNTALSGIPNILASKTGFTQIAGGNLAIIFDPGLGRAIIILVLGSTYNGRFDDVRVLSEATITAFKNGL